MQRSPLLAVALMGLVLLAGGVSAADDAAAESKAGSEVIRRHILTDIPEASQDIDTTYVFPDYPNAQFPAGERIKVLLGLRNSGESAINVTHIAGSLNAPTQWSFYVMNFTAAEHKTIIEPGKEASFEYQIYLDPQLAGHEFTLALTTFYTEGAEMYASTFYNSTIPVLDPAGSFDTQTLFMYLSLFGIFAAAAYGGLQATGMLGKLQGKSRKSSGGKRTEMGTSGGDDEWLQGTAWTTFGQAKQRKPPAKKPSKK